jgi:hypothetical protein
LTEEADAFLFGIDRIGMSPTTEGRPGNVFCYRGSNGEVDIRLGSIHSVKGETHTATLVLDTFHLSHNLKSLKPWLLGKRVGDVDTKVTAIDRYRLKQHYVAMTRPSQLLCLATRIDFLNTKEIAALRSTWRIADVTSGVVKWY